MRQVVKVLLWCTFVYQVAGAHPQDRQAAVAGQFYPAGKRELTAMLGEMFSRAVAPAGIPTPAALIVPHAGYVFSGIVAASGYACLDPDSEFDNIFLLGPSHHVGFEGAAVYGAGDFLTPLGRVPVNRSIAKSLTEASSLISARTDAHRDEHSLEVQLPFLQYRLKRPFKIVPIVFGTQSPAVCAAVASVLRPYFTPRNLFIISTDFSHYPSYADAVTFDKASAEAILTNSSVNLLTTIETTRKKHIANLATSMCGLPGVLTLLEMTGGRTEFKYELLHYRNSGDAPSGDRRNVVGYCAIAVSRSGGKASFTLGKGDRKELLGIARKSVEGYLKTKQPPEIDTGRLTNALKSPAGAFVTLKSRGELRGCIGRFDASEPLYRVVEQMAIAAATEDYRFPAVRAEELEGIEFEISVLTPLRRIRTIDEFVLGKHGIYIKNGGRSGTFLPQVAEETGWTREELLGHCSQDKAGLGWDGWKDAELYVYEAFVFSEQKLE
jgi:hypothetical protein